MKHKESPELMPQKNSLLSLNLRKKMRLAQKIKQKGRRVENAPQTQRTKIFYAAIPSKPNLLYINPPQLPPYSTTSNSILNC